MENKERQLAEEFLLHTDQSIFLTGKAGTGKTTFLQDILKKTDKKYIVVAPTGVAAINAGGMTIHSTFQLPRTAFLPDNRNVFGTQFTDRNTLAKSQKLRKERRQLFIELELLIIDEISMVRADVLDAIDFTLRRIRRNPQAFGGVQLLAIGDLYQLAPVIRDQEWFALKNYYQSPFFFDALAWKQIKAYRVELQKVYRQEDDAFISILNNIRNGIKNPADIDRLNKNYDPNPTMEDAITLTTHNKQADAINERELKNLEGSTFRLKAAIKGKFS